MYQKKTQHEIYVEFYKQARFCSEWVYLCFLKFKCSIKTWYKMFN